MLPNSNGYHNGFLDCESDYEERPILDITSKPAPHWSAQLAGYTGTSSWLTPDGISQSVTIRADTLTQLLSDMRLLSEGVRRAQDRAKKKAAVASPEAPDGHTPNSGSADEMRTCKLHQVPMAKRLSRKSGKPFWAHSVFDEHGESTLCFGKRAKS